MGLVVTPFPLQLLSFERPPEEWVAELGKEWKAALKDLYQLQGGPLECLILAEGGHWRAAGIICPGIPHDLEKYRPLLMGMDGPDHRHIGFLWTFLECRQKGWGSVWLKKVKERYKARTLWLTIEEEALLPFYHQNGFRKVLELGTGLEKEWVLVHSPK